MTPITFSSITFLYLCVFAVITPSLAAQDDIQQRSPFGLGKTSPKVGSPKPVVPPKAAPTTKANSPPVVTTSKPVVPPTSANPPPVTTSKAVVPPTSASPSSVITTSKPTTLSVPGTTVPGTISTGSPISTVRSTSTSVLSSSSSKVTTSATGGNSTSSTAVSSSALSQITTSATGNSTSTTAVSSSAPSQITTAINATATASPTNCTLKRASAAGAGAVAQCSRPDGEDGSGGCDPCDDACTTNKRRSNSLEDDDDIQVVYGNETVPFWPGHSLRMRLIPRQLPQLEFDCTATSTIPKVCQNMCFAQSCAGHSATLTRSTNKASCQAARKTNSCGVTNPNRCSVRFSPPATPGQSCDEYPFASTREAQNGQGGIASTRCVPAGQNSSQGGKISGFYKKLVGTQFEVVLAGQGAAGAVGYCAANPVCTKTNGQL